MILCLAYVVDDRLNAFLVVDREWASTLSPPFLANRRGRGIMCGEWTETFLLQRLEPAGAPGLELLPDLLGFAVARHDDVHMVRAAIDGVESPPPHPAMIGNGQFDEPVLVLVEKAGICRQAGLRLAFASGIGKLPTVAVLDPPAHRRAARCHTLARSENRPRVRAKAVRNHVSLCFSSVSLAWSIDVPSHNVTHQPDTPATGPSKLVIRRVAGSQISHIFRRPARVPRHPPRSRVGLVCSSMRNFLAGVIIPVPGGAERGNPRRVVTPTRVSVAPWARMPEYHCFRLETVVTWLQRP